MRKQILEHCYRHSLGHIPSALSMVDYVRSVFKYIDKDDKIVIGKPFGSIAYYTIWKEKGWIDDYEALHMGLKHDEVDFVDYSEETIGNALGVASGISLGTDKITYVNITDATLQMGNTLEAIQFIGQHQQNIICTVDYNNAQVTGQTSDIISVDPIISMFKLYNWNVFEVDGHNEQEIDEAMEKAIKSTPSLLVCKTIKGKGIPEMEKDIKKWHYKKIQSEEELQSLVQALQVT